MNAFQRSGCACNVHARLNAHLMTTGGQLWFDAEPAGRWTRRDAIGEAWTAFASMFVSACAYMHPIPCNRVIYWYIYSIVWIKEQAIYGQIAALNTDID